MKNRKWLFLGGLLLVAAAALMLTLGRESQPEWAALPSSNHDGLAKRYSTDILTESRDRYNYKPDKHSSPIFTAHDIPGLNKEVKGVYSYLGAAREFKHITGADMPDWVEPEEGIYSVKKRGPAFTCWTTLKYQVDPAKFLELQNLISQGYANRWPDRLPLEWQDDTVPEKGTPHYSTDFEIRNEGNRNILQYNASLSLRQDGLYVSNIRGVDPD